MPIISVNDNKNIDERETQKQKKKQKKEQGRAGKVGESYSQSVTDKWLCWAFKFGFFQFIFKASLFFKSNLELVLSITLKERELY